MRAQLIMQALHAASIHEANGDFESAVGHLRIAAILTNTNVSKPPSRGTSQVEFNNQMKEYYFKTMEAVAASVNRYIAEMNASRGGLTVNGKSSLRDKGAKQAEAKDPEADYMDGLRFDQK